MLVIRFTNIRMNNKSYTKTMRMVQTMLVVDKLKVLTPL